MIKVIINADDLGLNDMVNEHIQSAIEENAISSTTILANAANPDVVKHIYENFKHKVSFGVHLNLTQGPSLTCSNVLLRYGIIDENGQFTRKILSTEVFDSSLMSAIENEWMAQIQRLKNIGIELSHIDGHHHVHGLIPLKNVLANVAQTNNVRRIRSRYRTPISWMLNKVLANKPMSVAAPIVEEKMNSQTDASKKEYQHSSLFRRISTVISEYKWRHDIICNGLKTSDYFGQFSTIYNQLNRGMLLPENCTIELMCHPGHPSYQAEEHAIKTNRLTELLKIGRAHV